MIELVAMLVVTVVGTVIGTVLAMEAWASAPHLSKWLLRRTIAQFPQQVPADQRDRWARELEADFATYEDRRMAGLLFAIRLRWKGGRDLAAELALDQLTTPAPQPGQLETGAAVPPPDGDAGRLDERRLRELSIPDLAKLAYEETGLTLTQIASPRLDQRHRTWRRLVHARLIDRVGRGDE